MTDRDGETDRQKFYCSDLSRAVEEPLYGSAPFTSVWFLLEYPHPMGAKAFPESELPADFKASFADTVESIPHSRLVLVRQQTDLKPAQISLFIALSGANPPALYEFSAGHYTDLLSLDFPAILAQDLACDEHRRSEPIFLVCTNGKRDACCARSGLPLFEALAEVDPEAVWQSSHVGGHRFAPNLVCLPHGLYYGRVLLKSAGRLLEDYRHGQLRLEHYRGRSPYPASAQAAEYYLRLQSGRLGLDDYCLKSMKEVENGGWEILFEEPARAALHRLRLSAAPFPEPVYESCRSVEKTTIINYRLEGYGVEAH